jgi:hypothetical protein
MFLKPTQLIYTGNCKNITEDLNNSLKNFVLIQREDIKVKKGTVDLEEYFRPYYPVVSFECKDNVESPSGKFIIGDFGCNSFDCHGVMRKL